MHSSIIPCSKKMCSKNWKKVNKIFVLDSKDNKQVFQKSKTADLISRLDLTLTHFGQEQNQIESLKSLRPFIRYFQLIGFLPISIKKGDTGVWVKKPNPLLICTTVSVLVQLCMTVRSVRELVQTTTTHPNPTDEVAAVNGVIYYVHTISMTLIMVSRINLFPGFIDACKRVEHLCKKYQPLNDHLVRHCWIVFGYFVLGHLFGNAIYYYSQVERNNVTSATDFSDAYEFQDEKYLDIGFMYSVFEFYCDCGWLFGDILIALLSVILSRFFWRLNKGISASSAETVEQVEELRKDHRAIKDLVEQCNSVFSPIILVNYMGNLLYLLTRLYTGVSDDLKHPSIIVRIESLYAFGYQISKIMVPTWLAALLNEKAFEAIDYVHDWGSLIHSKETRNRMMVIQRFVSQLINDAVGLSGCGYFIITKSFLVTLISGILTYEVIILQFQQSGL